MSANMKHYGNFTIGYFHCKSECRIQTWIDDLTLVKEISNAAIPAEMNYRALLVVFQWLDFFLFCFFSPNFKSFTQSLLFQSSLNCWVQFCWPRSYLLVHASVFLVIFLEGISCKESITIQSPHLQCFKEEEVLHPVNKF